MVHLSTIYPWIKPFLKGIHHALEIWRGKRDTDGWKLSPKEVKSMDNMSEVILYGSRDDQGFDQRICLPAPDDPPEMVIAVPMIKHDVFALKTLMSSEVHVRIFIRGENTTGELWI